MASPVLALMLLALAATTPASAAPIVSGCPATPPAPPAKVGAPNIILVLTDDMDLALGGMTPMTKTEALLGKKGVTAANFFIHTPICCPSRSELLTGRCAFAAWCSCAAV